MFDPGLRNESACTLLSCPPSLLPEARHPEVQASEAEAFEIKSVIFLGILFDFQYSIAIRNQQKCCYWSSKEITDKMSLDFEVQLESCEVIP